MCTERIDFVYSVSPQQLSELACILLYLVPHVSFWLAFFSAHCHTATKKTVQLRKTNARQACRRSSIPKGDGALLLEAFESIPMKSVITSPAPVIQMEFSQVPGYLKRDATLFARTSYVDTPIPQTDLLFYPLRLSALDETKKWSQTSSTTDANNWLLNAGQTHKRD